VEPEGFAPSTFTLRTCCATIAPRPPERNPRALSCRSRLLRLCLTAEYRATELGKLAQFAGLEPAIHRLRPGASSRGSWVVATTQKSTRLRSNWKNDGQRFEQEFDRELESPLPAVHAGRITRCLVLSFGEDNPVLTAHRNWWNRRDLHPQPPACKAGALLLSYDPESGAGERNRTVVLTLAM
jgi:hypothetical protein